MAEDMQTESIKVETITSGTSTFNYFKFGHGEKPFVILPGISVLSVMNFADAVADAYKVLTDDYTLYVMEKKIDVTQPLTIGEMAADTSEALKAMGLDKVTLMGASYGGMTSMLLAAEHPEQVENLILCATSAYVSEEKFHTFERWLELADAGNAEGLYQDFGKIVYPAEIYEQFKTVLSDMAKGVTEEDMKRFGLYIKSIRGFDVRDKLKQITCPAFLVCANDDQVFGSEGILNIGKNMDACPDLNVKIYNGCGHAVYDTAPDLKERILDFLKEAGRA